MPLSEAAKALLRRPMSGAKPLDRADIPTPADAAPVEAVDPQHQGFRDRAKREDERFLLATDTEFWLAFCFRKAGQPARFAERFGLQLSGRYLPGPDLAAAVGDRTKLTAAQRVKQMLKIQSARDQGHTCRRPAGR